MTCHFSWIDSPLPVDALGSTLWRLLSSTADEDDILGINNPNNTAAREAFLNHMKQSLAGSAQLLIGSIPPGGGLRAQTPVPANHLPPGGDKEARFAVNHTCRLFYGMYEGIYQSPGIAEPAHA
ncbi:MAG: hypothetical protein ACOCVV_11270 [Marinobacter sp.]